MQHTDETMQHKDYLMQHKEILLQHTNILLQHTIKVLQLKDISLPIIDKPVQLTGVRLLHKVFLTLREDTGKPGKVIGVPPKVRVPGKKVSLLPVPLIYRLRKNIFPQRRPPDALAMLSFFFKNGPGVSVKIRIEIINIRVSQELFVTQPGNHGSIVRAKPRRRHI
ncbi:MAG TPA: hypothetical protein VK186_20040, partial [Candidatus Deferrimicrobium sp.]|nr:hypothetical protein [Candidatus Deferrimicrobium sp.]